MRLARCSCQTSNRPHPKTVLANMGLALGVASGLTAVAPASLCPASCRTGEAPKQEGPPPLAPDVLRVYIAQAKQCTPHVPPELTGACTHTTTYVPSVGSHPFRPLALWLTAALFLFATCADCLNPYHV